MVTLEMCNELKNSGVKVRSFLKGGKVGRRTIPANMLKPNDVDVVLARLQPGEIVIPVKHTTKVKAMLKKAGIKLPNM